METKPLLHAYPFSHPTTLTNILRHVKNKETSLIYISSPVSLRKMNMSMAKVTLMQNFGYLYFISQSLKRLLKVRYNLLTHVRNNLKGSSVPDPL